MKWGGATMYEASESGLNEYGEIVLQHFALSGNHRQLRHILVLLKKYDLNPSTVFSDVPDRDRGLFESIFETLTYHANPAQTGVANGSDRPILPPRNEYIYAKTIESAEAAVQLLSEALDDEEQWQKRVVSIDAEWALFDGGRLRGKVSVVILGSDVIEDVIIIHLAAI
jgi:hypothetical protein